MGCCKSSAFARVGRTYTQPFLAETTRSPSIDFGDMDQESVVVQDLSFNLGRAVGSSLKVSRADFGDIFEMIYAQKGITFRGATSGCAHIEKHPSFEGRLKPFDAWSASKDTVAQSKKLLRLSDTSHTTPGSVRHESSTATHTTHGTVKHESSVGTPGSVRYESSNGTRDSRFSNMIGDGETPWLPLQSLSPSDYDKSWELAAMTLGGSAASSLSISSIVTPSAGFALKDPSERYTTIPYVSVESVTHRETAATPSCQQKQTKMQGGVSKWRSDAITGYGCACRKGHKPDLPNQDSFLVVCSEALYSIFGVFDGHGPFGHHISDFVKEQLPRVLLMEPNLEKNTDESLKRAFEKTQRLIEQETTADRLDAHRSGTTVTLVLQNHAGGDVHVAHVGDSRCVLGKIGADGKVSAVHATQDHKPEMQEERDRIEKAGGEVRADQRDVHRVYAKGKLYPSLGLSRALGDLTGVKYAGLSPQPDIHKFDLEFHKSYIETDGRMLNATSLNSRTQDSSALFLLICSDGVWEYIGSEEAVEIVARFSPENAMEAADCLAMTAWDRWEKEWQGECVDDITVLVVHVR